MLRVDRHDLTGGGGFRHQRSAGDKRFLVRQRQARSRVQSRQCRFESQRTDERIEDNIGTAVPNQFRHGARSRTGGYRFQRRCRCRIGDGDVRDAGCTNLFGQQLDVVAARCKTDYFETVGVGSDDLQRLGTDRTGTAEEEDAGTCGFLHSPIVPDNT